jgi:hypothetical protein
MTKRPAWNESRVSLSTATVTMLDGPGDDYVLVVRGTRIDPKPANRKAARPAPVGRRRQPKRRPAS